MASQPAINMNDGQATGAKPAGGRIARMRERYQTGPAYISIERARYYTESWQETEGKGIPVGIRVALAMKNVYEKMTHYLDPDDRIAGYWCEHFLGIPVDIERGVFNSVLEAELDKGTMIKFRAATVARGLTYIARKRMLSEFFRNQRISRESGASPLNMDFKTMSERRINPYQIKSGDKEYLLKKLIPYWKGRTTVDRVEKELMQSGLLSREMNDFVLAIPGNTSKQVLMLSTCATIASYHAHIILDYGPILKKGLLAMKQEITDLLAAGRELGQDDRDFLKSVELAMEGVIIYARRLASRIQDEINVSKDQERLAQLDRLLRKCGKVPLEPAASFEEAVQSMWTVKTAVEVAHPVYLHCFGRLDQELYPYYRRDRDEGRTTPEAAVELLSELLLKIMSQNIRPESNILSNFYHRFLGSSPVTLAGIRPDGEDGTNDLTYLLLEAAHRSKAITNVSVRVHEKTPEKVLDRVASYLASGTSSFSIFNDEVNIKAMQNRGFSEEDARDYAVMGCVETTCPGRTGPMSANALQLAQLLNITLRNGDARLMAGTLKGDGLCTGEPDSFKSFDALLEALYQQAEYFMDKIAKGSNLRDQVFAEHQPAPLLSAFVQECITKRKDVTRGGGRYVFSGISMINSIANLVDSLYVIRELVFERKQATLPELLAAVDNNFKGHEDLYRKIRDLEGKWGNGDPSVDRLAHDLMKRMFGITYKYRSLMGGPFVAYIISMITHTIDGRLSIASLDGRKAAKPYAASCNPYNVERRGVTAALRSVASLPFEDVMGCAVNVKFHPTGVGESEEARAKWASLVRTYFKLGGSQIQPTVASAEMLRAAQQEPENYRDLIVKVGGYSTYFVDLGREIQQEIIERTEHC
ncbi:MAG TPA: pyruvate formate lyase family protein [bacterium]|nr:pyruvate formate lyase family protein [bacterium]